MRRPRSGNWLGFDEAEFLGDVGLHHPVGERGRSALQRMWIRPTADINGIWGGYTGAGLKTVIASEAFAKVSFRLVPSQKPEAVVESFRFFLAERLPPDAVVTVETYSGAAGWRNSQRTSPWMKAGPGGFRRRSSARRR